MKNRLVFFLLVVLLSLGVVILNRNIWTQKRETQNKLTNFIQSENESQGIEVGDQEIIHGIVEKLAVTITTARINGPFWLYINKEIKVAKSAPPKDLSVIELVGTSGLILVLGKDGVEAKIDSNGNILYAKGDIRAKLRETFTKNLYPGIYKIELGLLSENIQQSQRKTEFPLTFIAYTVEVRKDQTTTLEIEPPTPDFSPEPKTVPVSDFVTRDREREYLEVLTRMIQRKTEKFNNNDTVRLLYRLQNEVPTDSTIMADLPDSVGGPRQLDAQQIRIIVDYLKEKYWSEYDIDHSGDLSPEAEQVYQHLKSQYDSIRESVEKLKDIAKKLDAAGK